MLIHRVLNEVFRSWTHVAVLRALVDSADGLSGNAVARSAGMHPRSAFKALTVLEVLHVVRRQRGGRDHLFTLNREHLVLEKGLLPLYTMEGTFMNEITRALSALLARTVVSAVVFGSVARHEEGLHSDMDICCITRGMSGKQRVREVLDAGTPALRRRFGVRLAPLVFTVHEFRALAGTTLVKNIAREGVLITGQPPRKILDGKTQQAAGGRPRALPVLPRRSRPFR